MPEKLPPHDLDAEEAVCGSLLIDGSALIKIELLLSPADFYGERTRLLFDACLELSTRNEAINQITVAQEMARQGKLETCGGAAYLSHLISICPTSLDIEYYANIVVRLSVCRRLALAGQNIQALANSAPPDLDNMLNKAEDAIFNLRQQQKSSDFITAKEIIDGFFEQKDGVHRLNVNHLPTGFTALDNILSGGLAESDLIILAARPSMGKTSLALKIARNVAVIEQKGVMFFSLEMSRGQLAVRLLSIESSVSSHAVNNIGLCNEDEERRLMDATGILSDAANIFIDDQPRMKFMELRSRARRLMLVHPVQLIIIDHIGLLDADYRVNNRVEEMSYITRQLKALARELRVPTLALCQLNRASDYRVDHHPQLSDLRDSGSIEQDADVVAFIYREEYYIKTQEAWDCIHQGEDYPPPAEIVIAKHRNGPTGVIKLRYEPRYSRFENMAFDAISAH